MADGVKSAIDSCLEYSNNKHAHGRAADVQSYGVENGMNQIANTAWYNSISEEKSLPLRCPFATVVRCPRYYQSLSLLSATGATPIDNEEADRFLKKWEGTELWPRIREHETSVSHSGDRLSQINNFCPEVTYDRYGLFCTNLGTYADEIDKDLAHRRLSSEGAGSEHPNWRWSYSREGHFSECPLYSVLSHNDAQIQKDEASGKEPWWREHLSKIVVGVIVALAAALFKWLLG